MKKITFGTSYFINQRAITKYYTPYGFDNAAIQQKLERGEIHIGKPDLRPGDVLKLNKEEGRYFIETTEKETRHENKFSN
jgi:hypothetical protein